MVPSFRSMRVIAAAGWAFCVFATGPALAAKLDDAACDALKTERARLDTEAIKSDMAKGPQWAKDNLTPERLKEIEQLIGLQESITFRCTRPKPLPVALPAGTAKPKDGAKPNAASADPDASVAATALSPLPGTSPDPAPKITKKSANTKKAPAKNAEAPAQPAAKSDRAPSTKSTSSAKKSKPKVSDVYVPPAKNQGLGFASDPATVTGEASSGATVAPLSP